MSIAPLSRFATTDATWVRELFPQGSWMFDDYIWVANRTNWQVELVDGRLERLHVADMLNTDWVAELFPRPGEWTFGEYLDVTMRTRRKVELVDGRLEVLPLPTRNHEETADYHQASLNAFAKPKLGRAIGPNYVLKNVGANGRQPDVLFVLADHVHWLKDDHSESADIVVEVLSQDRSRDLVSKRAEYAAAGIAEYHIDDLEQRTITVLTLRDGQYVEHGVFRDGQRATSPLLPGWEMDVTACLDAGRLG